MKHQRSWPDLNMNYGSCLMLLYISLTRLWVFMLPSLVCVSVYVGISMWLNGNQWNNSPRIPLRVCTDPQQIKLLNNAATQGKSEMIRRVRVALEMEMW